MQLTMRRYRDEDDFWRIRAFLRELLLQHRFRQRCWHVARFDYWRWHGNENIEHQPMSDMIFLWETLDGQIAAMLNAESKGEAFLHILPAYASAALQAEMLATAEAHLIARTAEGRPKLRVWVEEHDQACREWVLQRGYAKGNWPEYMRQRLIDAPIPEASPAPGFTVRSLGDGLELLERCYASGLAFHENDIRIAVDNRNDVTWYRNIQTAPLYRRDLDIVAIAPDGAVASFCTVWFDDVTRTAVFEPVATVPAYQRRGLGKAVMCEALRRLKRMGAQRAYVGSYSVEAGALYASVGFTDYDLLEGWDKVWE
jgi:GNAT superfamily N-acetyltransferase